MEQVVVAPEAEGLGVMLAELVRGNLASDPARAALLDGISGRVNITAVDAGVSVGILFGGCALAVGAPFPSPDLDIRCDAETLMGLSSVPLRFGRPDPATREGRAVLVKMLRRRLRIRGMLSHPKLLTRLQKLLSVA